MDVRCRAAGENQKSPATPDKWNKQLFFELSGARNSAIGSDQIDYVNFRPNGATYSKHIMS